MEERLHFAELQIEKLQEQRHREAMQALKKQQEEQERVAKVNHRAAVLTVVSAC
jgi:hypothetical protein